MSPILCTIYNHELVDQPINDEGGASAFIDEYFRWRCGRSATDDIRYFELEDLPRIERWTLSTGSALEVGKTELIHFTRERQDPRDVSVRIDGGHVVQPSNTVKLLGVMFDQELR